jgi:DNA-binding transcriptional regulator/RsmH inhibitor MraZ
MFGEKPIVGQTILRINKDRIILPSFTHAEPGDEISATLDIHQKKIILLQEKELIERLTTLHEKMKVARTEGRLGYQDYHNLQRYIFGMLPLHERILNKKLEYQLFNRKPVAVHELRQLERLLNLRDEVFAVGVGTTLEIYPDEQAYHEYQAMEEQRRLLKQPK